MNHFYASFLSFECFIFVLICLDNFFSFDSNVLSNSEYESRPSCIYTRAPNGMGQSHPIPSHPIPWDTFEKLFVPWDGMGSTFVPMGWDGMTFKSHGILSYFILEKDDYIQMSRLIICRNNQYLHSFSLLVNKFYSKYYQTNK